MPLKIASGLVTRIAMTGARFVGVIKRIVFAAGSIAAHVAITAAAALDEAIAGSVNASTSIDAIAAMDEATSGGANAVVSVDATAALDVAISGSASAACSVSATACADRAIAGSTQAVPTITCSPHVDTWSPSYDPSVQLWLEGDSITGIADGAPVMSWPELAAARTVSQSNSSRRPVLHLSAINGQASVRFDGIDDFLVVSGYRPSLTTGYTAFVVFQFGAVHDGTLWGDANYLSGAAGDFARLRSNSGTGQLRTGSNGAFYDVGLAPGTYLTTTVNAATSSGAGTLTIRVNGAQVASQSVTRSTTTTIDTQIGSMTPSGSILQVLNGDIAALIICSGALSAAQIAQFETYLRTKYAVY
jgi:hypothetical protein